MIVCGGWGRLVMLWNAAATGVISRASVVCRHRTTTTIIIINIITTWSTSVIVRPRSRPRHLAATSNLCVDSRRSVWPFIGVGTLFTRYVTTMRIMMVVISKHSFARKNSVNHACHFDKFCSSPWHIAVNSVVNTFRPYFSTYW